MTNGGERLDEGEVLRRFFEWHAGEVRSAVLESLDEAMRFEETPEPLDWFGLMIGGGHDGRRNH